MLILDASSLTKRSCGEYDKFTRGTLRLHAALQRMEQEIDKSDSFIIRPDDSSREQLERIASDYGHVLEQVDNGCVYSTLTEEKRSARKVLKRTIQQ